METVYVSLGSNLGEREQWLLAALARLNEPGLRLRRVASLWETEPVGGAASDPWYLNSVAELETSLEPEALMTRLLQVEAGLGRRRPVAPPSGAPPAPRTVDLDLVLYGERQMTTAALVLPHPRFRERQFVLAGLEELAPERREPVSGLTVAQLRARCADASRIVRRQGPEWAAALIAG